jgi:hypothetical protein
MAHLLLHGTLDATILEADHLTNPTRATGGAPGIFRKVNQSKIDPYLFFIANASSSFHGLLRPDSRFLYFV